MTLRLRISPCPNDTFMFDALLNGRIDTGGLHFDVEYRDIEALNRGVQAGEADVSKISCAVLPAVADGYALLDSGAALGRGNGPLLVRRAGDRSPIRRVAVPGVHTTANALMMRLFPRITERTPLLFSQIAAAVERGDFDAGVLIHEGRFVYRQRQLELVADLGQLWERTTALPLPLGGIAAKRSLPGSGAAAGRDPHPPKHRIRFRASRSVARIYQGTRAGTRRRRDRRAHRTFRQRLFALAGRRGPPGRRSADGDCLRF